MYTQRSATFQAREQQLGFFEFLATLAAAFGGVATLRAPELGARRTQHARSTASGLTVRRAHGDERELRDDFPFARVDVDERLRLSTWMGT